MGLKKRKSPNFNLGILKTKSTYKKGECVCVFPRKNLHAPRITFFCRYIGDLINQPFSSPMEEYNIIKLCVRVSVCLYSLTTF